MRKDRLKFIILYELKKGTVLANFFGWIDVYSLKDIFLQLKQEGSISGEVIVDEVVVLKDIEITEHGRLELEEMMKNPEYEKGYKICCENNQILDWVNGRK